MIINEQELMEDFIEGIADVLELEIGVVRHYVRADELEECISEMFTAESEYIHAISNIIQMRIEQGDK